MSALNTYVNVAFKGHYPIGTAAVVIAETREAAVTLLEAKLAKDGLKQSVQPRELIQLHTETADAIILCDGNY